MIKLTSVLLLAVLTCDQTNDIHAFAPFSSLPSLTSSKAPITATSTSSSIRVSLQLQQATGFLGSVGSLINTNNVGDASTATNILGEVEEVENRILVICDDKQDKKVQQVIDRFQSLISDQFDAPVQIETIKPTADMPMGGNNAQCVILSSTSLSNGQSSANDILSRVLRRTVLPDGETVTKPPSHFVVISPLGTERIDKYPYSMTNMMGGNKLKKAREVEEVIISTVKERFVADGNDPSLDYTILKLGDIVNDEQVMKDKKNGVMDIAPGDSLDGKVGIEAAANTLLQAVALRPTARNSTLSVIGGMATSKGDDEVISEELWDDWFLRLDGPELWRCEEGLLVDGTVDADRKFEELAGYINEWSNMFKNGAKGTGLTTPVGVVLSNFDEKQNTSLIRNKFGVRLEFKKTNTGSSYQSKGEEKAKRSTKGKKESREGGVEILVELTEDKNGEKGLRVRARRCNMGDSTVVKEMSEETIVKQLGKVVNVWKK
jgi:hypothetical protein